MSIFLEFSNITNTVKLNNKNLYYNTFNAYSCLRRSCYTCAFKQNTSDIVIGNAENFGLNKYKLKKSKKYSFIATNSEKGEAFIDSLSNSFVRHELLPEKMLSIYNRETVSNHYLFSIREQLLTNIEKYGYLKALKKRAVKYS